MDYSLDIHWLNPGFSDPNAQADTLSLIPYLLERESTFAIRDGSVPVARRVQEFRDFLYGWAKSRGLLLP